MQDQGLLRAGVCRTQSFQLQKAIRKKQPGKSSKGIETNTFHLAGFPAYIYTNCNRFLDVGFVRISDDLPYSTNIVPPHSTTLLPHKVAERSTRNGVAGTLPLSQSKPNHRNTPTLKAPLRNSQFNFQAVKLQAIARKAEHPKAIRFISVDIVRS